MARHWTCSKFPCIAYIPGTVISPALLPAYSNNDSSGPGYQHSHSTVLGMRVTTCVHNVIAVLLRINVGRRLITGGSGFLAPRAATVALCTAACHLRYRASTSGIMFSTPTCSSTGPLPTPASSSKFVQLCSMPVWTHPASYHVRLSLQHANMTMHLVACSAREYSTSYHLIVKLLQVWE